MVARLVERKLCLNLSVAADATAKLTWQMMDHVEYAQPYARLADRMVGAIHAMTRLS